MTVPTEIYTYLHPLSLHDALPILSAEASPSSTRDRIAALKLRSISVRQRRESPAASVRQSAPVWTRSEEHKSELQSLIRSSYAVFCLKKNTTERRTDIRGKKAQCDRTEATPMQMQAFMANT